MLPVLVAPVIEIAVNHVLRFAPGTRQALATLAGKRLRLDITAPRIQLTLCLAADHCDVRCLCEEAPDAVITGPIFSLLRHLGFATSAGQLLASPVRVKGDTQVVQQLANLIKAHDYDIEEPLSRIVGDVAAHSLGQGLKALGNWLGRASQEVAQAGGRWLGDEGRQALTRPAFNGFADQVEQLRDDTDRLEARVNRLLTQLSPPTT